MTKKDKKKALYILKKFGRFKSKLYKDVCICEDDKIKYVLNKIHHKYEIYTWIELLRMDMRNDRINNDEIVFKSLTIKEKEFLFPYLFGKNND